jgi:hypothetical protein
MVFMIEARGSGRPGEYRLNRVNVVVFVWYVEVIVVPRKELPDVKVVVVVRPCVRLTYVAHLGCVGTGVNKSKFGREGGLPCLSHHGSCIRQIRFSGFLENSCNAEIVVAWPRAQFSSCTDPTDARRAILCGYSRFWGVSHGGCIRVYFGNFAKLNPLRTVGVARLMGCVTVGAANRGVSAGWALLANRESAWVLLGLVGVCADSTARVVSA